MMMIDMKVMMMMMMMMNKMKAVEVSTGEVLIEKSRDEMMKW
jgi:hypothetical protein